MNRLTDYTTYLTSDNFINVHVDCRINLFSLQVKKQAKLKYHLGECIREHTVNNKSFEKWGFLKKIHQNLEIKCRQV